MNKNLVEQVNKILEEQEAQKQAALEALAAQTAQSQSATASPTPPSRKESPKSKSGPALFMVISLLAVMAVFFVYILRLKMLPSFYLIALGAILLVLLLIVAALTWNRQKRFRTAVGILLSLLITAGCVLGIVYSNKAITTLQQIIRGQEAEMVDIGIYVRTDDPAQSLADLAGVPLGRLISADRNETDDAIRRLGDLLDSTPSTIRYNAPSYLIRDVLNGQTRAMVINTRLLNAMANNMEDFNMDQVRLLELYQVEKPGKESPAVAESADTPFLMYISGIDDRTGLTEYSLTDVNILAAVNPATRQILLIHTPRDYYVKTPVSGEERDKLTHAGLYGVECSIGAMSMIYDLEIDYYFRVDFSGFKAIIDALGGVDVYSDRTFTVESHTFTEGMNHMTGYQALLFSRHRKGLVGGDRARGIHQMAVINAVIKKMASSEMIKNFFPLMDAMAGSFETSVPYNTLAALVQRQLSDGGGWTIKHFSVDGADSMNTTFSLRENLYVMIPDEALVAVARQLILDVLDGKEIEIPGE